MNEKPRLGFALCGSFCTFKEVFNEMKNLSEKYEITPIFSEGASAADTRFGKAESFLSEAERITGKNPITTIIGAEPIGPKALFDLLLIEPCTGNTLAKLAAGIADTSVTMAAKAHLRNGKPLVIAISTNDGLGAAAKNIGALLNTRNIYFVPFKQDNPEGKPRSLVAVFSKTEKTIDSALIGKQFQPLLV